MDALPDIIQLFLKFLFESELQNSLRAYLLPVQSGGKAPLLITREQKKDLASTI